jgi:hypothetical protein
MSTIDQALTDERNRETSRQEVAAFRVRSVGPYTAYLSSDSKRITTWIGETLATVISTRKPYRAFGRVLVTPFSAIGIDGRKYHGTHNGAGMHLTIRPSNSKHSQR